MRLKLFPLHVLVGVVLFVHSGCSKSENDPIQENQTGTFVDSRDQKTYEWLQIGTQTWMAEYLGGTNQAYNKLLESGTAHWDSPNSGTNTSKFSALPSGYFDQRDDSYNFLGHLTMFHSTTKSPSNNTFAMGLILNQNYSEAGIEGRPKDLALPVRCIKD